MSFGEQEHNLLESRYLSCYFVLSDTHRYEIEKIFSQFSAHVEGNYKIKIPERSQLQ